MSERVVPCWAFRYEALGYESAGDGVVDLDPALLDDLVARSGRTIPPPGTERWDWLDVLGDMCDLDEGHAGDHVFVPQDSFVLVFPTSPGGPGAGSPTGDLT